MKRENVEIFIKEHNVPSMKHAWVLYEACTNLDLRQKYWACYCYYRDGKYYKPNRYAGAYEHLAFPRHSSVYPK